MCRPDGRGGGIAERRGRAICPIVRVHRGDRTPRTQGRPRWNSPPKKPLADTAGRRESGGWHVELDNAGSGLGASDCQKFSRCFARAGLL